MRLCYKTQLYYWLWELRNIWPVRMSDNLYWVLFWFFKYRIIYNCWIQAYNSTESFVFVLGLFLFIGKAELKHREERQIFFHPLASPVTTVPRAGVVQGQEWGDFSGSLTWTQGPKDLTHLCFFPRHIDRGLNQKWSSQDHNSQVEAYLVTPCCQPLQFPLKIHKIKIKIPREIPFAFTNLVSLVFINHI